jgi:hypothetical protein
MKVIEYKLGGSSFPIIVDDGTQIFLVKLSAGMSGEYSLLSEWFGNVIGKKLGINTRQPKWIYLTDLLEYNNVYIEVRDLIEKSMGLNISFEYIENAKDFSLLESESMAKEKFIDVYLLDVLMLNIDRTVNNLNLMRDDEDNLIVSDFESSLIFNEMLNGRALYKDERILQCLKTNPFYQKVESRELDIFTNKLNELDLELLIFDLPSEVLSSQNREKLQKEFEAKRNINWGLTDLLDRIDNVSLETDEEKEKRIKRNREKLEKLVNSKLHQPLV